MNDIQAANIASIFDRMLREVRADIARHEERGWNTNRLHALAYDYASALGALIERAYDAACAEDAERFPATVATGAFGAFYIGSCGHRVPRATYEAGQPNCDICTARYAALEAYDMAYAEALADAEWIAQSREWLNRHRACEHTHVGDAKRCDEQRAYDMARDMRRAREAHAELQARGIAALSAQLGGMIRAAIDANEAHWQAEADALTIERDSRVSARLADEESWSDLDESDSEPNFPLDQFN